MTVATRRWDGDPPAKGCGRRLGSPMMCARFLTTLGAPDGSGRSRCPSPAAHSELVAEANSSWTLRRAEMAEAVYVVSLDWAAQPPRLGRLRADLFALLGTIAESATYIHQRVLDDAVCYDVATGMLAANAVPTHGHLVRLRIGGDVVRAICAASRIN